MEERAQGAIEYLLIIGAAILVVAIVILAVTGALGASKTTATSSNQDANLAMMKGECMRDCNYLGAGSTWCQTNSTTVGIVDAKGQLCH